MKFILNKVLFLLIFFVSIQIKACENEERLGGLEDLHEFEGVYPGEFSMEKQNKFLLTMRFLDCLCPPLLLYFCTVVFQVQDGEGAKFL